MQHPSLQRAYQTYERNTVETKTQGQLIIMLYDGAIKFISIAEEALAIKDVQLAHQNIVKAQKIINELSITLKGRESGIGAQLAEMYDYLYFQLTQANVRKEPTLLVHVKEIMIELRDTWKKII